MGSYPPWSSHSSWKIEVLVTRELCMSGYMVSWCIRGCPLSVQNTSKHLGVRNDRKWLTSTWCFFAKIGERFGSHWSHCLITPIMVLMMKIDYLLKLANFTRIFPKKSTARLVQWDQATLQFGSSRDPMAALERGTPFLVPLNAVFPSPLKLQRLHRSRSLTAPFHSVHFVWWGTNP